MVGEQLAVGNAASAGRRPCAAGGFAQGAGLRSQLSGKVVALTPAGTVQTGAAEDSRIYLSLDDFEAWTGIQPSTIEVAANGLAEEVAGILNQLAQSIPSADVRPVRQIMEGEARVLGKTRQRFAGCFSADHPDSGVVRAFHADGMGL